MSSKKLNIPTVSLPADLATRLGRWFEAVGQNINIITGRVNNKITPVNIRALTVSNPPTQAEVQAVYQYATDAANKVNEVIARLDG